MSDRTDIQFNRGELADLNSAPHEDGQVMFGHDNGRLAISLDYTEDNTNKRALLQMPTSQITTTQLRASTWSNGRYSFENTYPFASYDLEISPAEGITDTQLKAFGNAKLISDDSENTLIAKGIVPTIDIPIKMEVRSK